MFSCVRADQEPVCEACMIRRQKTSSPTPPHIFDCPHVDGTMLYFRARRQNSSRGSRRTWPSTAGLSLGWEGGGGGGQDAASDSRGSLLLFQASA